MLQHLLLDMRLIRFSGEPRICDLPPGDWEDWKTQTPNDVAELQLAYNRH
jgi:hypothetical protein